MKPPELALSLRPEQRMLLLPRMLQALDVLQLPRPALEDLVSSALAENEALAVRGDSQENDDERSTRRSRARGREASDRKDQFLRNQPARRGTLRDHLISQLWTVEAPPRVLELLRVLAESLDARGLRALEDDEWAASITPRALPSELAAADAALRQLDPAGAGARDGVEAMLSQLSPTDGDRPLVERILRDHLDDLARHRRGIVASALAVSEEDLELLLAKTARLSPRPSAGFDDEATVAIRPDLVVRRSPRGVDLHHADSNAIDLEIDPHVLAWSKDRTTAPEIRNYLRERIDAGKALLQCLEQRRATLERVARTLFLRQSAFLEKGPRFLRPLRMQEVADALSIHPSTISRAVAGKYAETDWGIFRLRDFFESGVATTTGEAGSRASLLEAIRQLFAEEGSAQPLDDEAVVERLRAKGYVLARRTVAKYRADLGIPSSWHRRRARTAAGERTHAVATLP